VLGIGSILYAVIWSKKHLIKIDNESIFVNMPSLKSVYTAEWIAVKAIAIGINSLRISETDGKDYLVSLGDLKYNDLKKVKGFIIEMCEAKRIPYRNE
jgi:hypothetical protein